MRSVQEHVEQADRYADAVLTGFVIINRDGVVEPQALVVSELMLHAADIELKLAEAKSRTIVSVADG